MPAEPPDPVSPSTVPAPAGEPPATAAPAVPATSPGETAGTRALGRLMDAWRARHSKPPAVLYHYTTAQGLHGMLTSGRVWATNVGFLNDPSEMRYAARLIRDVIKEESGKFKAAQPA